MKLYQRRGWAAEITDTPLGPMYQAGTLSSNPLAMSAGIAALELIRGEEVWRKLEQAAGRLEAGTGRFGEVLSLKNIPN